MSQLFSFDLPILSIEPFTPDDTEGYDEYERPSGYNIIGGKKFAGNAAQLSLVSVMINPSFIAKCPVDVAAMGLREDQKIKIIIGGRNVACIINKVDNRYVFFNKPIRRKYNWPKVVAGFNMAMVSVVAGYILYIIFKHQQSQMGMVMVESGAAFLCLSSLIYAFYYLTNDENAQIKLRQHIKKILK